MRLGRLLVKAHTKQDLAATREVHMRRSIRTLNVAFILVLVLGACTGGQGGTAPSSTAAVTPKDGGKLTIGTSQDVLTLDLPNYRSTQDLLVGGLVFDTLVRYDKDAKLRPALAESWQQIDPLTYEFTLRGGVKFTDGTPLDGGAVKAHFERSMKALKGQRFHDMIKTITFAGDKLTFVLSRPYTPFLGNLAFGTGAIQSPASIKQYGDQIAFNPVGSGPYKLADWQRGVSMRFVRNPDYWGAKPRLDEILVKFVQDEGTRMASLEAGELDVIQNAPPQRAAELKKSATLRLITMPYGQTFWLGFTATNQYLKDARVRRAIAMMVDRNTLVETVTEGIARVATGFLPPELVPPGIKPVTGDVNAAKSLMADAGFPNGFTIDLWAPNGTYLKDKEIAQAVQAPLKQIGIDAKIRILEYSAYADGLNRHEAGLFVLGWAHTSAPDGMLRGVFHSKSAANWSAYKNDAVDKLIDDAVAQPTYEAAVKIWQQIDQKLVDDGAGAPIYWSTLVYATRARVHDFYPTPLGLWDVSATWVE
jgi:peptide/nickel transport system substrate-binding protein